MRDIIFRGRRIDNNEWVYGYLQFKYIDVDQAKIYDSISVRSYDVILDTVGQYTEINDVDGGEIYEGMTVHQQSVVFGSPDIDFVGKVKYYDGSCWIDNGKDTIPLFNENCENKIIKEY